MSTLHLASPIGICAILLLATLAGFFGLDDFFVRWSERVRDKNTSVDFLLRLFSFTPFPVAFLFVLPAIYFLVQLNEMNLFALTIAPSLALGVAFAGKYVFGRTRPFGHTTYIGKIDSAFPSAHAAGSFATAFVIASLLPSFAVPALIFAGIVALSRIYLQLHFFSDILGGTLLAYLATLLVLETDFLNFLFQLSMKIG